MKFKTTYLLPALLLAIFCGNISAQQQKGQIILSAATGISKNGLKQISHTMLFNATCDYGIKENYSLGLAVSQQGFTRFATTQNADNQNITVQINSTLLNIGVRPLYHFSKREDLDLYAGTRLGCSVWKENFEKDGIINSTQQLKPSAQLLGGVRWYLDRNFGITGELAIGSPYFISLGVHYKL